jgi:hypothetical protein
VEDLFKSGRESLARRISTEQTPSQILTADKDNFDLAYDSIVRIEVEGGPRLTAILVLTRQEKFEFYTSLESGRVVNTLRERLGEKVVDRGIRT